MNFGVNLGAIGGLQTVDRTGLLTGWTRANDTNRTALNRLLGDNQARPLGGWVGDFLKTSANEDKKRIVQALATQIEDIWNSASYRNGGTDPYKIVSRLAVLTHELGATPVWNCKSGKDRTGELDVEAKFLATQIQLEGEVPAPGHEHTPEQKSQFMQMALNSGNHEMQRLNVGVMGFKLEGMQGVIGAQMGGSDVAARHAGLSKHVKS
ncbi:MAG: inositol phosphate phosphatase SopB [Gammaproteobacteria bacterium]